MPNDTPHYSRRSSPYECPVCDWQVVDVDDGPTPDGLELTCPECDTRLRYSADYDCIGDPDAPMWVNCGTWTVAP